MNIRIQTDCTNVNWEHLASILKTVGMAHYPPESHRLAFSNSYAVIFLYAGDRLIGFGRALSDGAYQAALYDLAVDPDFQKQGLGSLIANNLMETTGGQKHHSLRVTGQRIVLRKKGIQKNEDRHGLLHECRWYDKEGIH